MKTRAISAAAVALVVLVLAMAHLWGPSTAPAGQPPLLTLTSENFTEFSAAFDAGADVPRMLVLLSPT
jgi:hypothetical protein